MNCQHCQKELPENYGAVYCPFCGKDLALDNPGALHELPPVRFNGLLFLSALLLPPLLTLLSAALMRFVFLTKPTNEGISPCVALVGGCIGGVICGVLLGMKAGRNLPAKISLSILFSAIMMIVCVALCFFGCGIGGYQMRIGG